MTGTRFNAVIRAIEQQPAPRTSERLPFTVRVVKDERDLLKAIRVRHSAYARHVPALAETLQRPEAADFDRDAVVLLAESRLDGSPLGTARIQTNEHNRLAVEQSVVLPSHMNGLRLAEVTRLGVEGGRIGRVVKVALVKACFQYCAQNGVSWAIAAGRAPIDQQYADLLFEDIYPEAGFIPLQHAGGIPHRVMAFEIATGHARWQKAGHHLLNFFSYTDHPDIDVSRHDTPVPLPGAATPRMPGQSRTA